MWTKISNSQKHLLFKEVRMCNAICVSGFNYNACMPTSHALLKICMLYTLTTHLHRHVFHFSAVVLGRRAVQSSLSKETGKVSLIINLAKQLRWCPSTPSVQVTTKCECQEYFIGNVKCILHLIYIWYFFVQKVFIYSTLISNVTILHVIYMWY